MLIFNNIEIMGNYSMNMASPMLTGSGMLIFHFHFSKLVFLTFSFIVAQVIFKINLYRNYSANVRSHKQAEIDEIIWLPRAC